jgi:hypothetical protein
MEIQNTQPEMQLNVPMQMLENPKHCLQLRKRSFAWSSIGEALKSPAMKLKPCFKGLKSIIVPVAQTIQHFYTVRKVVPAL